MVDRMKVGVYAFVAMVGGFFLATRIGGFFDPFRGIDNLPFDVFALEDALFFAGLALTIGGFIVFFAVIGFSAWQWDQRRKAEAEEKEREEQDALDAIRSVDGSADGQ